MRNQKTETGIADDRLSFLVFVVLLGVAGCDRVTESRIDLVKFIIADEIRSNVGIYVPADPRFKPSTVTGVFIEVPADRGRNMFTPLGEWARFNGWNVTWAIVDGAVWINDRRERIKGATVWVAIA